MGESGEMTSRVLAKGAREARRPWPSACAHQPGRYLATGVGGLAASTLGVGGLALMHSAAWPQRDCRRTVTLKVTPPISSETSTTRNCGR